MAGKKGKKKNKKEREEDHEKIMGAINGGGGGGGAEVKGKNCTCMAEEFRTRRNEVVPFDSIVAFFLFLFIESREL